MDHSCFLLEIDTEILETSDFEMEVYWVTAMEVARRAHTTAILKTTSFLFSPHLLWHFHISGDDTQGNERDIW